MHLGLLLLSSGLPADTEHFAPPSATALFQTRNSITKWSSITALKHFFRTALCRQITLYTIAINVNSQMGGRSGTGAAGQRSEQEKCQRQQARWEVEIRPVNKQKKRQIGEGKGKDNQRLEQHLRKEQVLISSRYFQWWQSPSETDSPSFPSSIRATGRNGKERTTYKIWGFTSPKRLLPPEARTQQDGSQRHHKGSLQMRCSSSGANTQKRCQLGKGIGEKQQIPPTWSLSHSRCLVLPISHSPPLCWAAVSATLLRKWGRTNCLLHPFPL